MQTSPLTSIFLGNFEPFNLTGILLIVLRFNVISSPVIPSPLDKPSFNCPLIQFQGLDDKVVPPNQALEVYDALIRKNVPTACVLFEGEQHGFRRAANIRRALYTELEFYGKVFGFEPEMPDDHVNLVMGEKVVVKIEQEENKPKL